MEYEIRNEKIEELLRGLGRKLKADMPAGYGFSLLIFGYENHELFYISSAQREDVVRTMREFIEKFEEKP
jgi:hypothetical protein